jgi:anti-anti-sigma factor
MTGEPGSVGAGPGAGQPRVEVLREGRLCIVRASGEHDLSTADELRRAIGGCLTESDRVVVDLREATFVDLRIIGVLALCQRQATTRAGRAFAVVADGSSIVGHVLRLTGIDAVVPVYASLAEAAAAIA